MSADVIDLSTRRQEVMVWQCNCGTVSFQLRSDGAVECCGCGVLQNTGNAKWIIPEPREAEVTAFPEHKLSPTD